MPVHTRPNWEFYAVLDGRLAPLVNPPQLEELRCDTLWIFPPGNSHGWISDPGRSCRIVVFHFSEVPTELDRRGRANGCLVVPLSREAEQQIQHIANRLHDHYRCPNALSVLHFEQALVELSLLSLEGREPLPSTATANSVRHHHIPLNIDAIPPTNPALARVLAAENWYRTHLPNQPSIREVARAGGLSVSHLRRLFHTVRQLSPRDVFDRIRMEQAMQLLAHSDRKLTDVAAECGFGGASQFCQFFKDHNGTSPAAWRKHVYSAYQDPAEHPGRTR